MSEIKCYFAHSTESRPSQKCGTEATGFVRVKHSGRLCPLCPLCKESFIKAQQTMSDDTRKAMPGEASYEEVTLEAGAEEYSKQPPKKSTAEG